MIFAQCSSNFPSPSYFYETRSRISLWAYANAAHPYMSALKSAIITKIHSRQVSFICCLEDKLSYIGFRTQSRGQFSLNDLNGTVCFSFWKALMLLFKPIVPVFPV